MGTQSGLLSARISLPCSGRHRCETVGDCARLRRHHCAPRHTGPCGPRGARRCATREASSACSWRDVSAAREIASLISRRTSEIRFDLHWETGAYSVQRIWHDACECSGKQQDCRCTKTDTSAASKLTGLIVFIAVCLPNGRTGWIFPKKPATRGCGPLFASWSLQKRHGSGFQRARARGGQEKQCDLRVKSRQKEG
jgi:hypothetical protein